MPSRIPATPPASPEQNPSVPLQMPASSAYPQVVSPSLTVPQPPVTPTGPQESYAAALGQPGAPNPNYDFIINQGQTITQSGPTAAAGGGSGIAVRIAVVAGGLTVLLIAFLVLKSVLSSSGNNKPFLIGVVQSQQSIIHLTTAASMEKSLSIPNKNFAITAQLTLTSSQGELTTYLGKLGVKKIDPKVLILKTNSKNDTDLTAAAGADSYNPTFDAIMTTELNKYQLALKTAYSKTTGVKGQALLDGQFKQSLLLQEQLDAATTPSP